MRLGTIVAVVGSAMLAGLLLFVDPQKEREKKKREEGIRKSLKTILAPKVLDEFLVIAGEAFTKEQVLVSLLGYGPKFAPVVAQDVIDLATEDKLRGLPVNGTPRWSDYLTQVIEYQQRKLCFKSEKEITTTLADQVKSDLSAMRVHCRESH